MAEMTMPRPCGVGFLRCRCGRQLNRRRCRRGTPMRHFLLPGAISTLALGVDTTAAMRVLITPAGYTL